MGYIYKVTNTVNGKMYVGQTKRTIDRRWKEHIHNSFTESSFDKGPLHLAIKKYGADAFVVEQIEECENADLNDRETYWIKQLGTFGKGYNVTIGGEHPLRWDGEEILPLWNKGLSVKEIAKELGISHRMVSDRLRGEGVSAEEAIARGQKLGGITSRKPVYMYDRDGNYIMEFPSRHDASEAIGYTGPKKGGSFFLSTVSGYQFRRYKVEKLDTVIAPHKHVIHQYTLDGDYVTTYSS